MKKIFTFFVFSLLLLGNMAATNFTFSKKTMTLTCTDCSGLNAVHINITNNSGGNLYLDYNVINGLPDTACWMASLCDNQQCYSDVPANGSLAALATGLNPNVFEFKVDPKNYNGIAVLKMEVYQSNDATNIDTVTIYVKGCSSGNYCLAGINEIKESNIMLWPNPAKDFLNLSISGANFLKEQTAGIYNILGENVMSTTIKPSETEKINISNLGSGIYFLRYQNEKGNTVTRKFYKGE